MKTIFLKTIREKRNLLIILCIVSVITLWMYISLFPTFSKQSVEFERLLESFPKELWEVFGIRDGNLSMSTLEKFLSVEMYSLLWPILNLSFFISLGVSLIGGEIDKGTIEILLSLPTSRIKIYLSKYLAGITIIVILCFVSIYSIIPMAILYDIQYNADTYHKLFLVGTLFCISGFSVVMLLSIIFEKGKATLLGIGMYIIMYIFTILSSLKDNLKDLQYFSFFHYLDASELLAENKINESSVVVFSCVIIVSTALAIYIFHKKDISV